MCRVYDFRTSCSLANVQSWSQQYTAGISLKDINSGMKASPCTIQVFAVIDYIKAAATGINLGEPH